VVLAVLARGVLAPRAGSLVRVILGLIIPVVGAAAVRRRAAALAAGPAAGLAVVVVLRGERREDGRERRVSARGSGRRKLEEDENSKGKPEGSRGRTATGFSSEGKMDEISASIDAGVGGARSHRVGAGIRGAVAGIHVSPLVLRWGGRRGSVGVAARSPAGARCRGDRAPPRLRAGGRRRWERDGSRRWGARSP